MPGTATLSTLLQPVGSLSWTILYTQSCTVTTHARLLGKLYGDRKKKIYENVLDLTLFPFRTFFLGFLNSAVILFPGTLLAAPILLEKKSQEYETQDFIS